MVPRTKLPLSKKTDTHHRRCSNVSAARVLIPQTILFVPKSSEEESDSAPSVAAIGNAQDSEWDVQSIFFFIHNCWDYFGGGGDLRPAVRRLIVKKVNGWTYGAATKDRLNIHRQKTLDYFKIKNIHLKMCCIWTFRQR